MISRAAQNGAIIRYKAKPYQASHGEQQIDPPAVMLESTSTKHRIEQSREAKFDVWAPRKKLVPCPKMFRQGMQPAREWSAPREDDLSTIGALDKSPGVSRCISAREVNAIQKPSIPFLFYAV